MANKDIDIHPTAICATEDIGPGTTVGPYVTIDAKVAIGAGCTIGEGVSVRDGAVVGDRVTIGPGSRIAGNTKLGDDSCVHPNVVFEQTRLIEPLAISSRAGNIEIGPSSIIGAQVTILPSVTIGRNAAIAPNSVVTRPIPPFAYAAGNPATVVQYLVSSTQENGSTEEIRPNKQYSYQDTAVSRVTQYFFKEVHDVRGDLSIINFDQDFPFPPKRIFFVSGVRNKHLRGEHAHRDGEQLLVSVSGSTTVLVDDGQARAEFILDRAGIGLYIGPLVWSTQYNHDKNSTLIAIASNAYDPDDYIRNYDEFIDAVTNK